jgi:hypothetical protein
MYQSAFDLDLMGSQPRLSGSIHDPEDLEQQ